MFEHRGWLKNPHNFLHVTTTIFFCVFFKQSIFSKEKKLQIFCVLIFGVAPYSVIAYYNSLQCGLRLLMCFAILAVCQEWLKSLCRG